MSNPSITERAGQLAWYRFFPLDPVDNESSVFAAVHFPVTVLAIASPCGQKIWMPWQKMHLAMYLIDFFSTRKERGRDRVKVYIIILRTGSGYRYPVALSGALDML